MDAEGQLRAEPAPLRERCSNAPIRLRAQGRVGARYLDSALVQKLIDETES